MSGNPKFEKDIYDRDITGRVEAKSSNFLGDAHEYFVVSILMRLGFNEVALAEDSADKFDLLLGIYNFPPADGEQSADEILKVQIKASSKSVSLEGGGRAGADRNYQGEGLVDKTYRYSEDDVDMLIGVDKINLDLYLIPIGFIEEFDTKTKSFGKMKPLKNNWELLLNWNEDFKYELKQTLPDFQG